MGIFNAIIFFMTFTGNPVHIPAKVCAYDLSHLNYDTRIEIAIGCSTVNGTQYYSNETLEELYNE